MVVDIESPSGTIRASDRNKYVGGVFYEALLNFPVIGRTVGEWLSSDLQFSTLTLELSNVDGRFNNFLPEGADFGGWIGKSVEVRVGIAEASATYTTVFKGRVTDVGGFKRSTKSITVIARDVHDSLNVAFPNLAFSEAAYPKIEVKNIGKLIPVIYGDWTIHTDPDPAAIPAFTLNGNDPEVHFKDVAFDADAGTDTFTAVNHDLDNNDKVQVSSTGTLPAPLLAATTYWVINSTEDTFQLSTVMAGAAINITTAGTGNHNFIADPSVAKADVQLRISENDLVLFDSTNVYLKRGDIFDLVPAADVYNIGAGNKTFSVKQNTANLWVTTDAGLVAYLYEESDIFYVRVKGKTLGGYEDNLVWQARDILMTYGLLPSGDFDANWSTYRDKSTPAQSSISTIRSRIWIQEAKPAMTYALQLLEQVRLEAFLSIDLKVKLNSLHFEDWNASPTFVVKNWDVEKDSFKTSTDERNNFNRAQGFFNFLPSSGENSLKTKIWKNPAAITQMGKAVSKMIEFPNLVELSDVEYQVKEIIRLASSSFEVVDTNLTWRSLLQDIGDFVLVDVKIGSAIFDNVPAMVRDVGYDPAGLKRPIRLWSLMMVPFPGYVPGYTGTVGGYNATITEG